MAVPGHLDIVPTISITLYYVLHHHNFNYTNFLFGVLCQDLFMSNYTDPYITLNKRILFGKIIEKIRKRMRLELVNEQKKLKKLLRKSTFLNHIYI